MEPAAATAGFLFLRLQWFLTSVGPGNQRESFYRDLVDSSTAFLCVHDTNGILLLVNHAAAEALGYASADMEGRELRAFAAPAYANRVMSYLARVSKAGYASGHARVLAKHGNPATWFYSSKLLKKPGDADVVLVQAQDVSDRVVREQQLRETNKLYRCLFEEAPVAYHEIDAKGVVVNLNRAECELLGWEKDQVLGRPVWELVSPEHREVSRLHVLRKLAGNQPLVPFLREYIRPDGRRVLCRIHENLIRSASGEIAGIRSTLFDVTEQHRVESELRRLNTELDRRVAEQTSELRISHARMREFVYTVSHDLQEPLRSIASFAKLLTERYADRLDKEGVDFLEFVTSGTVRMSQLIRDLLAYSHVLHDEADLFEPSNLNEIVDLAIANLNTSIESSGAQVTRADLPVVSANPNRLLQLFQNLIGNAIKYRSEAPPRVRIDARRQDSDWIISVTDNGIGVDPGDRERIFGLFKRTQEGSTPGSGIGLAICYAIVEKHGGRIWVEPAPDGGSIFSFTLPLR